MGSEIAALAGVVVISSWALGYALAAIIAAMFVYAEYDLALGAFLVPHFALSALSALSGLLGFASSQVVQGLAFAVFTIVAGYVGIHHAKYKSG